MFDREQEKAMSARNDQEELGNVNRRSVLLGTSSLFVAATLPSSALAQAQKAATPSAAPLGGTTGSKPNILFIMGDDIGWYNVSAYNMGIMGYRTPNIDRIGKEAQFSPTGMVSRAAPQVALPSSRGKRLSAPVSPRSAYRVPNSASDRWIPASLTS